MAATPAAFELKQFSLNHHRSSMKVSTDSILLGSLCEINDPKNILDIGTGCGILALMMAQKSMANITAIDVDLNSIHEAKENFQNSPWDDRLKAIQIDLETFSNDNLTPYDLIISNPPYFNQSITSPNQQRNIARNANLLTFETLIIIVKRLLAPNGDLWLILPTEEFRKFSATATAHLLGCSQRIDISHRLGETPVLTVSHWKHFSENLVHRISTRSMYDQNHQYSEDFKALTQDFYPKF